MSQSPNLAAGGAPQTSSRSDSAVVGQGPRWKPCNSTTSPGGHEQARDRKGSGLVRTLPDTAADLNPWPGAPDACSVECGRARFEDLLTSNWASQGARLEACDNFDVFPYGHSWVCSSIAPVREPSHFSAFLPAETWLGYRSPQFAIRNIMPLHVFMPRAN